MGRLGFVKGCCVMAKVMDVKQISGEAKGHILPLMQPTFKGSARASPQNI